MTLSPATARLLNLGHALDHLFLLIFATAVTSIAPEFGFARWEDLLPYSAGAFLLFGLGSVPAGRLGDLRGRRNMMVIFFFGIGRPALRPGSKRPANGRCADPARGICGDLPPGRHPDAAAAGA